MNSVFISHSHKDKIIARKIAKNLEEDGLKIWIDATEYEDRGDKECIYFTLAEASYGLGNLVNEKKYCLLGKEFMQGGFALNSYLSQKVNWIKYKLL